MGLWERAGEMRGDGVESGNYYQHGCQKGCLCARVVAENVLRRAGVRISLTAVTSSQQNKKLTKYSKGA